MSISEVAVRDAELLAIKEINEAGGILGCQIKAVEEKHFFSEVLDNKDNYSGELAVIIDNNTCFAVLKAASDIFKFPINEEIDNGGKFNDISLISEFLFKIINKIEKSLP